MSQVLQWTQFEKLICNLRLTLLVVVNHFIDRRRTETLARISVLLRTARRTNVRIENVKMAGLVFAMANRGVVNVG